MTRQEYRQLSPQEQKQGRHDLLIAACCMATSVIMIIVLVIKGFTN